MFMRTKPHDPDYFPNFTLNLNHILHNYVPSAHLQFAFYPIPSEVVRVYLCPGVL